MGFTIEMGIVVIISAAALTMFVLEVVTPDLVALLAVLALLVTGVATPEQALSGFSNPAVLTIAAMFIISGGLIQTGVVDTFTTWLVHLGRESPARAYLLTLVSVLLLSAFVNNTPIVVMMIPVALAVAESHGFAPSKILIPLSYASIFGGACTLLGTSTNLVVSGLAEVHHLAPFGLFEFAAPGLILATVGMLYVWFFGRHLLPDRQTVTSSVSADQIREYLTELVLLPGCRLAGRRVREALPTDGKDLRLLEIIRDDEILWPPFDDLELREQDVLLVKGSVAGIVAAARRSGVQVIPELGPDSVRIGAVDQTLAEVVVSPGSRFEGATIGEVGFRLHFDVAVLALQRHGRHHLREKLPRVRLRTGDMLLVQGDAPAVDRLKREPGMILLEGVEKSVRNRDRAPVAAAIFAAVLLFAAASPLPIVACTLAGAVLMVLTGCLSGRQFYRSLDPRTLVLIAAMIGLGVAAEATGTAKWVADRIIEVVRPLGPTGVLAVVYLMTNLLTEVLSNAAAAVLMVPLAISAAGELHASPRPFLFAVAFAASASFSTPIGYQTNTIVYGPGGYRFLDFTRIGAPLNLLFFGVATAIIPWFWPFHVVAG